MEPLKLLREIKSATFSTVDGGLPKARIIDIMFIEDNKIFFTTARGKSFYKQITDNPCVAVTGMDKKYRAVRVNGRVQKVEHRIIDKIFELNPMMNNLYPGEKREILEPFCIYEGTGEVFDLSVTPPKRTRFTIGESKMVKVGYSINENCTGCGICKGVCPEDCISSDPDFTIDGSNCLECGLCYENCPTGAINKPEVF